jgi:cytidylate kinase
MNTKVVAVARQVGASGEEVAREVAKRLNFRYVDYQIVQDAAREAGASPEAVSEAERAPSLLTRILETLARNPSMPEAVWANPTPLTESPLYTSADYRKFIEAVVTDIANTGNCVIVGHSGQAVLRGRPDVLRTLITGTPETRSRRLMKAMGIDEKEALKAVQRSDHDRIIYVDRFYNIGWLSPDSYDICINTDHFNVEQAADLIVNAANLR